MEKYVNYIVSQNQLMGINESPCCAQFKAHSFQHSHWALICYKTLYNTSIIFLLFFGFYFLVTSGLKFGNRQQWVPIKIKLLEKESAF